MPIYEYRCQACGHKLEVIQKLSDASLTDCPACSQASLSKLVSAAGFRLKGGGWYETDFKNNNKRNLASDAEEKSGKKSDGDGVKKSEDKSESKAKPDTKTETKAPSKPETKSTPTTTPGH